MIKKIEIENYKSFGEKTEIKLGKFNVLVGPNNSGKSNFLDFLSFVRELIEGSISSALTKRGGYKSVVFNSEESKDIYFLIEAEIAGEKLTYSAQINKDNRAPLESLKLNGQDLIIGKNGEGRYWNEEKKMYDNFSSVGQLAISGIETHIHPLQLKLRDFLRKIDVYKFELPKLRQKGMVGKVDKLSVDGSNLIQAIHYLRNKDRELYEEFENKLRAAIPEIKYLETPPTEDGKVTIEIVEENLNKRIELSEVSDGILWLLAHLYVFSSPEPPSMACFEEPSAFIHPRILELIVDLFKSVEQQVIVTTHNPIFVNCISSQPEDLIIFEKREGKTKIKRIEKPEEMKERAIRDIPLGEIWYSGVIGGVP
ncbi:MAG: AAA family ATPase [Conexivisphaerales archaeon]